MGNCYSIHYIAEDHTHTDITYNTEGPQQKYLLGTVSISIEDLNMFYQIQTLALIFCSGSKHLVRIKVF